jgi:hypothetical protein
VDIEHVTTKYFGQPVRWEDLQAAARIGDPVVRGLGHAVERAARAVDDADTELAHLTATIAGGANRVQHSIGAPAGQPVPGVNPLGELQAAAARFDALIGLRADRIGHLNALLGLWQQARTAATRWAADPAQAADLGAALTGLGLQPVTPAHRSTDAAYGHRHNHNLLDVSVDPFGEPGVEVNASHIDSDGATVVWTATFGSDTPATVVVAAVRAALNLHGGDEAEPAMPRPDLDVSGQVARHVTDIMAAIDGDIADGTLPGSVACFGDLHTYLDANAYLDEARVPMPTDPGGPDIIAAVQDEISRRLSAPDRVGLDLAGGQALGIQRDDRLVEPVDAAGVLGHNLRREPAGPIPRNVELHRADFGLHRLR